MMNKKIGRNDPCPCGSGKKYKQCCLSTATTPSTSLGKAKKFKAKLISTPKQIDLIERTFGSSIAAAEKGEGVATAANPPETANPSEDPLT
jgi:SEC-C motif